MHALLLTEHTVRLAAWLLHDGRQRPEIAQPGGHHSTHSKYQTVPRTC